MPSENSKATSQIFSWFEKMKGNYEKNLTAMIERFERNADKQNLRIDKQNTAHVESLQLSYNQQLTDKNQTIEHLNKEINFYKQQLSKQQETIEHLNGRYDAVMHTLLSETKQNSEFKNVVDEQNYNQTSDITPTLSIEGITEDQSEFYNTAMELRRDGDNGNAFILFEKAAKLGNTKSMGALARAYFLNEGVEEDKLLGLAWLIKAAELNYEPAIKKCEDFKLTSPELYENSLSLVDKI